MNSSEQPSSLAALTDENGEEETGKLAIRLSNAGILALVLRSALELNIVDIIYAATSGGGAPISPSQIAARIPAKNPDAPILLDRMLHLLASYGIFKCTLVNKEDGSVERLYSAKSIHKFPVKSQDQEGSVVAPLFLLHHDEVFIKSWKLVIQLPFLDVFPFCFVLNKIM